MLYNGKEIKWEIFEMYHIIFNPKARNGKSNAVLEKVEKRLQAEKIEYKVHATSYKGHAEELANELSRTEDTLIVVGGDGTVHEAVNGIIDPQRMKLVLIPAGTGNDFCDAAGITADVDATLDKLLHGEAKDTDYIELDGRRSLNSGGMGMDVEVLERCERGALKGRIKYVCSLVASMFAFHGYKVRVSVNGETFEENALIVAICNGPNFGGGIRICPGAEIDDGRLELVVVRQMSFFGIIKTFIGLLRGKILESPQTLHYYCDKVSVLPEHAHTVQLDGELYEECYAFNAKLGQGLKIYR